MGVSHPCKLAGKKKKKKRDRGLWIWFVRLQLANPIDWQWRIPGWVQICISQLFSFPCCLLLSQFTSQWWAPEAWCLYLSVCVCAFCHCRVWLFCKPMDCNPPGSSVHGISQARILEWVAISFSGGSSRPRKNVSPALQADSLPLSHQRSPCILVAYVKSNTSFPVLIASAKCPEMIAVDLVWVNLWTSKCAQGNRNSVLGQVSWSWLIASTEVWLIHGNHLNWELRRYDFQKANQYPPKASLGLEATQSINILNIKEKQQTLSSAVI